MRKINKNTFGLMLWRLKDGYTQMCLTQRKRRDFLLRSLTFADKRGQYDDIDKVSKLLLSRTLCV